MINFWQTIFSEECDLRKLYKRCEICCDVFHIENFEDHKSGLKCTGIQKYLFLTKNHSKTYYL